jgi:hypothetical protein
MVVPSLDRIVDRMLLCAGILSLSQVILALAFPYHFALFLNFPFFIYVLDIETRHFTHVTMVSLRQRRGTRASSEHSIITTRRVIMSVFLIVGVVLYQQRQIPLESVWGLNESTSLVSLAEATNRSVSAPLPTRGVPAVEALLSTTTSFRSPIEIDIISIGSKTRPRYQDIQERTFGSHVAVRRFHRINEAHDYDADCHSKLKLNQVQQIVRFCRRKDSELDPYHHYNKMRTNFANFQWLMKKPNPAGWMCAQKRPADGFYNVLSNYKDNASLPDYLMIMDDDTYMDLEKVAPFIQKEYPADTAYAVAGCMIRSRIREHNFTIPFGGWGVIFSRPAIENFQKPLFCEPFRNNTSKAYAPPPPSVSGADAGFTQLACWRLYQDSIGELPLFSDGMSVAELMHAYVKRYSYTAIADWQNTGFCMHSDWVWGYFTNFYHIAIHTETPKFANILEDRMRGYNDSLIYAGRQTAKAKAQKKECWNSGKDCTSAASICHYVTPEQMESLHKDIRDREPNHYRSAT